MLPPDWYETLLAEKYDSAAGLFAYGSTSRGEDNDLSDVDVIIVFSQPVLPHREKFLFKEKLVDAFVYDSECLNGTLHQQRTIGQFVLIGTIASAGIVGRDKSLLSQLSSIAKALKSAGPLPRNFATDRQALTALLDDLQRPNNLEEAAAISCELYSAILSINMAKQGIGGVHFKHSLRELEASFTGYSKALTYALREGVQGNTLPIRTIAKALLRDLGGELRDGYKCVLPEYCRLPLYSPGGES